MNRKEWYLHWREVRVNRPKLVMSQLTSIFKDIYGINLNEIDRIKYDLIDRYQSKVSKRLEQERLSLKAKGEKQATDSLKTMIYSNNPVLKLINKKQQFTGCYYPLPIERKA